QQVAVTLEREVDGGIEQRVAGAHERCGCLSLRRDQRLLERDAFVTRQYRLADANEAITVTHWCWHMRHLIASRLALLGGAAQALKRLQEERFDVVRLQPSGLGTLHLLADPVHAARVH